MKHKILEIHKNYYILNDIEYTRIENLPINNFIVHNKYDDGKSLFLDYKLFGIRIKIYK